jgi:hypothetical protein
LKAIEDSFPHVVPDPVIPAANEYQRKLSFEITEALAKRKSPKEALDSAAAEWEKITDRRARDKQKAMWGERLHEMKQVGIEHHPEWAAKAKYHAGRPGAPVLDRRARHLNRIGYFSASIPALAICASCADVTPDTPIAPMILPSTTIGMPPSSGLAPLSRRIRRFSPP